MSKAILVIDMPNSCKECMCYVYGEYNNFCERTRFVISDSAIKPVWCPLKALPEKMEGSNSIRFQWGEYEDGWNNCIDYLID